MFGVAEFGSDFHTDYQFNNGDLNIISDKENIVQSIKNRLNCINDYYSLFYDTYGGFLHDFHGWKRLNSTLHFMEVEVLNILSQDPRFNDIDVDLAYNKTGGVDMSINLVYDDDSDLSLSFIISDDGEIVENEEEEEVLDGD